MADSEGSGTDPNEVILAGLTRYEIVVNGLKRVADPSNDWSAAQVQSFAADVLKVIGTETK